MFKSIRLFKLAGIPVYIHWTFFLLIAYVVMQGLYNSESYLQLIFEVLVLLSVFACVTLHEYGHALTAKRYGILTQDIILSPIGGVARLNGLPEKPKQELFVAIAGPMVNVVIVILLLVVVFFFYPGDSFDPNFESINKENFLENYIFVIQYINISLVVFNMIPAFPMDGGRVLRSLLAMKYGRLKATKVAAFIGQAIAAVFIASAILKFPIFGRPISSVEQFTLSIIGLFVFSMARSELNNVKIEEVLSNTKASDLMIKQFTHLYTTDQIDFAVNRFKLGLEQNFLVFNPNDHFIGILKSEIIQHIISRQMEGSVENYFTPTSAILDGNDNLKTIMQKIINLPDQIFPVEIDGRVQGFIHKSIIDAKLKGI